MNTGRRNKKTFEKSIRTNARVARRQSSITSIRCYRTFRFDDRENSSSFPSDDSTVRFSRFLLARESTRFTFDHRRMKFNGRENRTFLGPRSVQGREIAARYRRYRGSILSATRNSEDGTMLARLAALPPFGSTVFHRSKERIEPAVAASPSRCISVRVTSRDESSRVDI